jgi:hypothetical protein
MVWTIEQMRAATLPFITSNEDMAAINQYISDTVALTPEAVKIKDSWIHWWDDMSWYDKNISTEGYDEARNRMHAFWLANALTKEEEEQVKHVMTTGQTTEEMEGGTRRSDSTGNYEIPAEPLIPTKYKVIGGIAAIGVGALYIYKKFNPMSLILGLVGKK